MATHKLINPKDKEAGKPDMTKTMNVTELKAAVKWLYEYLGLKDAVK